MTKIKICGISRLIDIDIVNEILPDYIGFVFAKSKRQISEILAGELKAKLYPVIKVVGVFVNEDVDNIIRLCTSETIDIVQLHGEEDEDYILKLKTVITNPIIKAIRVKCAEDIKRASDISCDYFLLDTFHKEQYGGSGETFDWSMITKRSKPFFLAGGIHSNNVLQAIASARPFCIDVSSGVETDGWKDRAKILELVTKIRSVI